jgi:hypothetical protein
MIPLVAYSFFVDRKKEDKMSDEIKKYEPMVMMMTALMGQSGVMPPQMPQMEWNSGFVRGFFQNLKGAQIEKFVTTKANIMQQSERAIKAQVEITKTLMTFGKQIEEADKRVDYNIKIMEYDQVIKEQQAMQEMIKTKTMNIELQTNELTYQKMKKELEVDIKS